jgi:DNA mismatch repair protein MutS
MAGVPGSVLRRAEEILGELEQRPHAPTPTATAKFQLTLFEAEESAVERHLRDLDVNALTPLQALQLLDSWKKDL